MEGSDDMSGAHSEDGSDDPLEETEEESFPASDPPSSWQGPEDE
jgi:hypothetical protein